MIRLDIETCIQAEAPEWPGRTQPTFFSISRPLSSSSTPHLGRPSRGLPFVPSHPNGPRLQSAWPNALHWYLTSPLAVDNPQ